VGGGARAGAGCALWIGPDDSESYIVLGACLKMAGSDLGTRCFCVGPSDVGPEALAAGAPEEATDVETAGKPPVRRAW
jgi:hypothetical protein